MKSLFGFGKALYTTFAASRNNNMVVVEYLRYTVPAAAYDAFISGYKMGSAALMKSPYAKSFELCECAEDSTKFLVRIEWTSAEDHMERFRKSDEFKEFFGSIKPYLKNIDEMRHYNLLLSEKNI